MGEMEIGRKEFFKIHPFPVLMSHKQKPANAASAMQKYLSPLS
jgi:hypothetical protein